LAKLRNIEPFPFPNRIPGNASYSGITGVSKSTAENVYFSIKFIDS
jgi:hypothetical protein